VLLAHVGAASLTGSVWVMFARGWAATVGTGPQWSRDVTVLLAEANVPYDQLYDMDDINDDFVNADVVLVIGANDVTNPAAKNDPTSPIYGMPILDVEDAKQIYVLKRSMKSGFAGIDNDLFYDPKTSMVFGDAKGVVTEMVSAVKQV